MKSMVEKIPSFACLAFARIAEQVIGKLDILEADSEPYPWFAQNVYGERDLQWTGIVGHIDSEQNALFFGLNLEFTGAWRRVCRKLRKDPPSFSRLLSRYPDYEWHWWGKPAHIARNPLRLVLSPKVQVHEVQVIEWVSELENILDGIRRLPTGQKMRPQLQVVRPVGSISQIVTIQAEAIMGKGTKGRPLRAS